LVIDRINKLIVDFIRKKSGNPTVQLLASEEGIFAVSSGKTVWSTLWPDISSVRAMQHPGFVGDTLVLIIEASGTSRLVSEDQEGWSDVVRSLPAYLPNAKAFEHWSLQLLANEAGSSVDVYQRP
jgi:hypothetical protein